MNRPPLQQPHGTSPAYQAFGGVFCYGSARGHQGSPGVPGGHSGVTRGSARGHQEVSQGVTRSQPGVTRGSASGHQETVMFRKFTDYGQPGSPGVSQG